MVFEKQKVSYFYEPLKPLPSPHTVSADPHCFHLSDLQQASTNSDHITCPRHGGKVVLEQLAPDVVISDLDSQFKVLPSDFSIEERLGISIQCIICRTILGLYIMLDCWSDNPRIAHHVGPLVGHS